MQTRFEAALRRQLRQVRGQLGLREAQARPHFLGVGTQKGGTSTLFQLLSSHPDVFFPKVKEVLLAYPDTKKNAEYRLIKWKSILEMENLRLREATREDFPKKRKKK